MRAPGADAPLALSLARTGASWAYSLRSIETHERARFEQARLAVRDAIAERMAEHADVLHGLRGLFAASRSVEREEFHAYVGAIELERHFPQVRAVGFCARRGERVPTTFIEPSTEANLRALGWDQASCPLRRAAMAEAAATGAATLTKYASALADPSGEQRGGFVLFLPVYRNGAPQGTRAEREAALAGFAFARISSAALLGGLFGALPAPKVDFEVFDDAEASAASLVHDDDACLEYAAPKPEPRFAGTLTLQVSGRTWTVRVASTPAFEAGVAADQPVQVLLVGATISALLFYLAVVQGRARRAAERMTEDLRRSEGALRESESRLARAEASSLVMPMHVGLDGRFLKVTQRFCDLLGYAEADLVGRSFLDVTPPEDRPLCTSFLDRFTRGELRTAEFEKRYLCKDGSIVWAAIHVSLVSDEAGRAVHFLSYVRDITDRKRVEEARARLTAILEATTDLVATFDPQGKVLYLNRAGRALLGLAPGEGEAGGAPLRLADLYAPEALRAVEGEGIPAAAHAGSWHGELALRRRDGREVPVSQAIVAHRGPAGEVEYLSTIARDVTDRRALEDRIRQSEKMEAVGRLAGGVAHDFNNLLTAISGFAEVLVRRLGAGAPYRREAEEIVRATARASSLTRQLLAFSRKQVIEPQALDLGAVIADLAPMLRRLIGEHIELSTSSAPDLGPVRADRGQVEQVVLNLALNARDAMPQGGRLAIEVRDANVPDAGGRARPGPPPGRHVVLTVTDTGVGMDGETLSHMFEPFFTTKEQGKGTGLGLSTVYGIVEQAGGSIEVASSPGRGSTFRIYLPRFADVEVAAAGGAPGAGSPGGRRAGPATVLVVEDDESVRQVVRGMVEDAGYTVVEARDGDAALEACGRGGAPIDLLLTDVVMPRMSGPVLATRARALRPALRILFMSGFAAEAGVQACVDARDGAFIEKPFTYDELRAKLGEVLATPATEAVGSHG